jgi:hypothetical protein
LAKRLAFLKLRTALNDERANLGLKLRVPVIHPAFERLDVPPQRLKVVADVLRKLLFSGIG